MAECKDCGGEFKKRNCLIERCDDCLAIIRNSYKSKPVANKETEKPKVEVYKVPAEAVTCACCGYPISIMTPRYCSNKCRQKAHRNRRKGK